MHNRYQNWVGGLNGDWLISRQRFFGVPIPLWYRLDDEGNPLYDEVLTPDEAQLPIDPSTELPGRLRRGSARQAGRVHRRPRRHGHLGDVVDDPAHRRRMGRRSRPVRPRVPDGHAPAGPRHHPHVAVRQRRAQPPRTRLPAVEQRGDLRLDPRPRPQEDVEEQGQRRHTDPPARGVRHRRRALLGGVRRAPASTPPSTTGR